jgi:hypothetical protein
MNRATCIFILLATIGCANKIKVLNYGKMENGKQEEIQINFKQKKFIYQSEYQGEQYNAIGNIEMSGSLIFLEFPEYGEQAQLGPFKKGYSNLKKIGESEKVELNITMHDLKYGFNFLGAMKASIISSIDSTVIQEIKSTNQLIVTSNVGNYILIEGKGMYYDCYLKIPDQGRYEVKVFLQPRETMSFYETTTNGCYLVTSKPVIQLRACEIENDSIKSFGLYGDCSNKYELIKTTSPK